MVMVEPALLSREQFFSYLNVKATLGKRILIEHPELVVRLGDRVLIVRSKADDFIAQLASESVGGA
jgi:hypothetical protein